MARRVSRMSIPPLFGAGISIGRGVGLYWRQAIISTKALLVNNESGGAVTILLVDDEASFRQSLGSLLIRQGFQVMESDSAEAACAVLRRPEVNIDLMIVDVVMPGISGLALADRVTEMYPRVKVIFMSGYPFRTLRGRYGMSENLLPFFLAKPFQIEALTRKIREVIGRQVSTGA